MNTHHFIVGTAGHIDHGKSALVNALTGTDPDRLPEEKARGMTIDLGFAHLELPHPQDPQQEFSLGIIDVPGHADFVKNMVAGVGGIDVALLVVAADDSWMPQTEEHVQILTYLGVHNAVIALTKSDLAEDVELSESDVRDHLEGTPFAEAPIVPTSSITGDGIDQLRETLARVLATTPRPSDDGKPRLAADRVFSVKGIGTVVTGTLIGGTFDQGQPVTIQPAGSESKIRTLQSHHHQEDSVHPGCRTAVSLQGATIASRQDRQGVERGDIVTLAGLGTSSNTIGAWIKKSDREIAGQAAASRPLRHGQWIRFHHGSAAHTGRLFFVETGRKSLSPGESTAAQLRFDEPVYSLPGDRFVLRDRGMQTTLAGGVILEPAANRHRYRSPHQLAFLTERAKAPDDPRTFVASQLTRDKSVPLAQLLHQSPLPDASLKAAAKSLVNDGTAVRSGDLLLDAPWWSDLATRAAELIDAEHKARPQATGLTLTTLAASLAADLPDTAHLDHLVIHLCAGDFATSGKFIHRQSHSQELPPALEAAADQIRQKLASEPLNPPGVKELAPDQNTNQALRFLIESGEAIRLDPKVAISTATYRDLVKKVRQFISTNGPATAAQLRDATGTTRRVLIPLLERLDADRITVRHGDVRKLPL